MTPNETSNYRIEVAQTGPPADIAHFEGQADTTLSLGSHAWWPVSECRASLGAGAITFTASEAGAHLISAERGKIAIFRSGQLTQCADEEALVDLQAGETISVGLSYSPGSELRVGVTRAGPERELVEGAADSLIVLSGLPCDDTSDFTCRYHQARVAYDVATSGTQTALLECSTPVLVEVHRTPISPESLKTRLWLQRGSVDFGAAEGERVVLTMTVGEHTIGTRCQVRVVASAAAAPVQVPDPGAPPPSIGQELPQRREPLVHMAGRGHAARAIRSRVREPVR